jgi:hypothetical protein
MNITSDYHFLFFFYLSLILPKKVISFIRNNVHYFRKDTALVMSDIATKKEIENIERCYLKIMEG